MTRLLLLLVVLNGLVPSLGEAVELVTHYASTGHIAHLELGESDLPDLGDEEHGCGPASHHCGCCVSISLNVAPPVESFTVPRSGFARPELRGAVPPTGIVSRLYRPPIA